MEPEIVTRPAFSVMGMTVRARGGSDEMPALWDKLMGRFHEMTERRGDDAYGVIDHFDEAEGTMDYTAGYEVAPEQMPPAGMDLLQIPAQTYAVFECTLPTLMDALDRAYSVWLPQSGYKRAAGPEFEFYGQDFSPQNPDSPMTIYIPIEPT
jgi:AraC family transcriptional regulator